MKSLYATALCAISMCAYAPAATVGLEDLFGTNTPPLSDRDFNDAQINVSGVAFHLTGAFVFVRPPGYSETPFPNGDYFGIARLRRRG